MKKLLLVLAVGAFVACNNGGGEETKVDTPAAAPIDTPIVTPDTPVINPTDTGAAKPTDTNAVKK